MLYGVVVGVERKVVAEVVNGMRALGPAEAFEPTVLVPITRMFLLFDPSDLATIVCCVMTCQKAGV
jgi:hypothetical protein